MDASVVKHFEAPNRQFIFLAALATGYIALGLLGLGAIAFYQAALGAIIWAAGVIVGRCALIAYVESKGY